MVRAMPKGPIKKMAMSTAWNMRPFVTTQNIGISRQDIILSKDRRRSVTEWAHEDGYEKECLEILTEFKNEEIYVILHSEYESSPGEGQKYGRYIYCNCRKLGSYDLSENK